MKRSNTSDPWNRRKMEIDPWDSPWRQKHERGLAQAIGSAGGEERVFGWARHHREQAVDCAFDDEAHHRPRGVRGGRSARSMTGGVIAIVCVLLVAFILMGFLAAAYIPYHISYYIYQALFTLLEVLPFLIFFVVFVAMAKNKGKK